MESQTSPRSKRNPARGIRAPFFSRVLLIGALGLIGAGAAWGQGSLLPLPDDKPIRFGQYPALSPDGKELCFSYLGDLWTVPSTGGTAVRLTVHEAHDAYPRWSPDGKWIAFSSNRDGQAYDVYVVPAEGGEARQLTFNSVTDIVNDWSPDGSKILFYSGRGLRGFEECTVDLKTGVVKRLTQLESTLRYASYSPDGGSIAYTNMTGPIPYWRPRYHGSGNADIFVMSLGDKKTARLTSYDGMDLWPMYSRDGKTVFYVSDVLGSSPNIVRQPAGGGKITAVTEHTGDAVRFPSIARNGSLIAYEYDGDLWTVKPGNGSPTELRIFARTEGKSNWTQRLTLTTGARELEVSPDGKTLAFGVRGEIWTTPSDKGGDATRLTENPANDYDFNWSPDSTKLSFISDRDGPYHVYVMDVKTRKETRLTEDPYDDTDAVWSPDGKTLAYLRSGSEGGLYTIPAEGGMPKRVAVSEGNNQFGVGISSMAWSPDGKWIAFSRRDALDTQDVWVVPSAGGDAINVTRYPGGNTDPRWTSDGKYLLFLSDRGDGSTDHLYAIPLEKPKDEDDGTTSTMPERPRRRGQDGGPGAADGETGAAAGGGGAAAAAGMQKPVEVKIDFDDIHLRAKALTSGDGVRSFAPMPDGKTAIAARGTDFWSVTIANGTLTKLNAAPEPGDRPRFPSTGTKFYYLGAGGSIRTLTVGGQPAQVNFTARMELDRRAEVKEAFNEFWRHLNTAFYDPKMHGVDWRAVRARYEPLLPHVGTREDFATLLSHMVGELNASHSEIGPASAPGQPGVTTASLGLEFDEDYAGPGLKVTKVMPQGPADKDPNKVQAGEYILSIDGKDVYYHEEFYRSLEDKAGRRVELVVNSKPEKEGARTVRVKAISGGELGNLDYERRVKEARAKVDQLSGGHLAYIHIQGMNQPSLRRFERELFGDAQRKDGLVLDIRNNGGGNTHDNLLGPLSRLVYGYTQPRDAVRSTQPVRHWNKPIILLINQNSASDAEIFPYGFRTLKLGKIVGVPTPGYVIGTYGGQLVDGTSYRIPMWGWFTVEGKNMENNGISPDVVVVNDPDQLAQGRDQQLETAVKMLLEELNK